MRRDSAEVLPGEQGRDCRWRYPSAAKRIATFKGGQGIMRFNGGTITPLADSQARGHQSLIGGSDGIAVNRQLTRQLADRR